MIFGARNVQQTSIEKTPPLASPDRTGGEAVITPILALEPHGRMYSAVHAEKGISSPTIPETILS